MTSPAPLTHAIALILRPLARLAIANGLRFRDLADRLKEAYVAAATQQGGQANLSRLSVQTGLQRKDIRAILDRLASDDAGHMTAGPLSMPATDR